MPLNVVATTAALVPLLVEVAWVRELSGLTLPDAAISLAVDQRVVETRRGGTKWNFELKRRLAP